MKGVIFNLLERVVTDEYGADVWDDLIDEAGVGGAYSSLGNYADDEVEALVAAAAAKTGETRAQVLHWFGVRAMPLLRELYPTLFDPHASSQDFVLSVNEMIHPEVRKLYPDAVCPFFHVRRDGPDAVSMQYESRRDMIDLAHGFLDGAAAVYGDRVTVDKPAGAADQLDVSWAR